MKEDLWEILVFIIYSILTLSGTLFLLSLLFKIVNNIVDFIFG